MVCFKLSLALTPFFLPKQGTSCLNAEKIALKMLQFQVLFSVLFSDKLQWSHFQKARRGVGGEEQKGGKV